MALMFINAVNAICSMVKIEQLLNHTTIRIQLSAEYGWWTTKQLHQQSPVWQAS